MTGFELGELFTNQMMRNTVILLNYISKYKLSYENAINKYIYKKPRYFHTLAFTLNN